MGSGPHSEIVRRAASFIRSRVPDFAPEAGLILGSGLGAAVPDSFKTRAVVPYSEIPGFPSTGVAGHEGSLLCGDLSGKRLAILKGRPHYYEGHSMESVVLPARTLAALGAGTLFVTAAVGSMRTRMRPGHFVAIKDHLNFMGDNPLRGVIDGEFGPLFTPLDSSYDIALRRLLFRLARKSRLPIHEGVYLALSGPSYETPSEIKALRRLGGDVIGMSVVPEIISARQMGLRTAALCWVSNMGSGLSETPPSHAEVLEIGAKVSRGMRTLLAGWIGEA